MANDRLIIVTESGKQKAIGTSATAGQVPTKQSDGSLAFGTAPGGNYFEPFAPKTIEILISAVAITSGAIGLGFVSKDIRIKRAVILSDSVISADMDARKESLSTYRVSPASICGGNFPAISLNRKYSDSDLIDWDRFLEANSCLEFVVTSITGSPERILLNLDVEEAVDGVPLIGFVSDPDSASGGAGVFPTLMVAFSDDEQYPTYTSVPGIVESVVPLPMFSEVSSHTEWPTYTNDPGADLWVLPQVLYSAPDMDNDDPSQKWQDEGSTVTFTNRTRMDGDATGYKWYLKVDSGDYVLQASTTDADITFPSGAGKVCLVKLVCEGPWGVSDYIVQYTTI